MNNSMKVCGKRYDAQKKKTPGAVELCLIAKDKP